MTREDRLKLAKEALRLRAETQEDVGDVDLLKVAQEWALEKDLEDWKALVRALRKWVEA